MIIDTLDHLSSYETMNPLFAQVVAFMKEHDLNKMEPGKYDIAGRDLFVNITVAKGKSPDEAVLETHRDMIDIQIPLSGDETYGYTPACMLPEAPYNAEKDITKFGDLAADCYVTCHQGMFAIFFPQDGHAPCISFEPEIKKAIFKVKA